MGRKTKSKATLAKEQKNRMRIRRAKQEVGNDSVETKITNSTTNSNTNSKVDTNSNTNSNTNSKVDTNSNTNSKFDTNSNTNSKVDTNSNTNSKVDTNSNTNSKFDTNSKVDTNSKFDTDSQLDTNSQFDTNTNLTDTGMKLSHVDSKQTDIGAKLNESDTKLTIADNITNTELIDTDLNITEAKLNLKTETELNLKSDIELNLMIESDQKLKTKTELNLIETEVEKNSNSKSKTEENLKTENEANLRMNSELNYTLENSETEKQTLPFEVEVQILNESCFLSGMSLSESITELHQDNIDGLMNSTNIALYEEERQQVCDELLMNRSNLIPHRLLIIQGNFHQGSFRFGNNAGKQCVANCLTAIAHSNLKQIAMWDQAYLDTILIKGNDLYTLIHGDNELLLVSDLPSELKLANTVIQCSRKDSYAAMIDVSHLNVSEFQGLLPLDQALQESLIDSNGCFITVLGYTSIAIKQNNRLYLFDSHARNADGSQDGNGSSIVIELESIEHLYQLLCKFVNHNKISLFEITGITVNQIQHARQSLETSNIEEHDDEQRDMQVTESTNEISIEKVELLPDQTAENVEVKITNLEESILNQTYDSCSDVDIEGICRTDIFDFKPTDIILRRNLCALLSVPRKYVSKAGDCNTVFDMGYPVNTKSIQGDGNCLFRAISYAVSQRQTYHSKVRAEIVKHIISNKEAFDSFTSQSSVEEHIANTKMTHNNTWGTAVEILAASHLLQTDIFTFSNGKWIKYSAHQINPDCTVNDKAIYLKHSQSHYEVVTEVGQNFLQNDCIPCNGQKRKLDLEYPVVEKKSRAEREKEEYHSNPDFRDSKLIKKKERYVKEKEIQNYLKRKLSEKYEKDQDYRESLKIRSKTKYENDETFRIKKKHASVIKYAMDELHRQNVRDASIQKYATDESHKQNVKDASIQRYATDELYRENVIDASIQRYATDELHRQNVRDASIQRYATDELHRQNVRDASIQRYAKDELHRQNVRDASIQRYAKDELHRQNVRDASIQRYAKDELHRQNVRDASIKRYAKDELHRKNVKDLSKTKYSVDVTHREKIKQQTKGRRSRTKEEKTNIDIVIDQFRIEAKKGPDHVCACCFRLFFKNQVLFCNEDIYASKGENIRDLAEKCIDHIYLHICTPECPLSCRFQETSRDTLWICYTCHRKLLNGQVPAECHANNLDLEAIPTELNKLNKLEQHLVALHIPFMKVLGLPKGGQKGVHGPVVCVPSNLKKVTSCLPLSEDENNMLPVKLKRKMSYKGYEEYQFVSTKRLEAALSHLMKHNTWYSHIKLDKEWLNPIPEEPTDDLQNELDHIETDAFSKAVIKGKDNTKEKPRIDSSKNVDKLCIANEKSKTCPSVEEEISDSYLEEGLQGVQLDTCLQPADIGQEVLDQCFDEVFNISPAEGNKPVSVLKEKGMEAKSFPVHYPSGKNTLTEERDYKLSLLRYFNLRLMSVDNRFAKDTSYIFFAQYLSELDRVISNVQIALRKESPVTSDGKKVNKSMLCNKDSLKDLLKNDQATKYLKPVRGTPPYWQATQKDIFAMIRQLGIPTFFCSFSSADFRWAEMAEIIMKQQGDTRNVAELDWKEKCKVLNSNPVTLARMFEHRFHAFLHGVILSDAKPIGKVVDYFFRVEFQQRGSPHVHCLFWVEDSPKFGEDDDTDVVQFVDQYITCEIPDKDEDPELNEMVTSLHQHSKNHSKTCKKKGTVCRFNFPRPPSTETFIAKQKELDDNLESDNNTESEVNKAKQRLSQLWECILNNANEDVSTKDILKKVNMTKSEFEEVASLLSKRNTIVLKREVNEIYINHYNRHLLRAWNANMDIQYVLDAYACVVYIISYISKAERELGLLLQQTKVEAQEGNLNAQQTMKKIGTAYLHHREISAQEAVFRVTGLKLKQCSRKVEFVPVGENPCRMSIPLKQLEGSTRKSKHNDDGDDDDDESIWMTSRVDRYKERPNTEQFEQMCLARFCSNYDVLSKSQVPQKINQETTFKLGKDLGYIRKRTRTKPAIVRYPRFSEEASPEKYYQSILQLFLPYRYDQQLKPPQFKTYEEFYSSGFVKFSDSEEMKRVINIVDSNKSEFIQNAEALQKAERDFEEIGCPEDAWGSLCPEAEVERHECNMEGSTSTVVENDITEECIPDLNKSDNSLSTNLMSTTIFPKNEMVPLLRAMNTKQRQVFYKIRDWCLQKARGETVEPFHVFITGGGGTGKSHLIKCLYYEMTRLLSRTTENPDEQTVLLTAPTGTAAFNISGLTIHSALGIFKNLSFDHVLLGEDKINTLRSKLESLQVLVIDEISMVNKRMLFFIHQRLRQIKKMPEDCLFGGVSVVAVGDFYQLPPVRSRTSDKLYVDDPSNSMNQLWFDLFEVVELDEIMRQRGDSQFSEMLNRLRVRSKEDPIEENDLCAIKQRARDGPEHALHIYATNEEVNRHNNEMVMKLDTEVKLIEAEDFVKDRTSGKLIKKRSNFLDKDIQLPSSLLLAVGSRVMVIKNIDTKDGLVNGVMGTVREINQSGINMPGKIFINFDNCKVGKNAQLKKSINGDICIGLEPSTEDIQKKNGSRKQFPLKLSWACTIHKVQGLTVQECVVDLSKCFSYGQAYVALSRVTSLNGLYVKDINVKTLKAKIYCDPDVVDGISRMRPFLKDSPAVDMNKTTLLYHNIEGLGNHTEDLKVNLESSNIDYICLTETWMNDRQSCNIEGYQFRHLTRYEAYDTSNEFYSALKTMNHGGVGVFIKNEADFTEVTVPCNNLECYAFRIPSLNLVVLTIYRTQKFELHRFFEIFTDYIEQILSVSEKVLVCGDFNQDIRKGETHIENYMKSKGFVQCVQSSTTESGTLIDHVYIKGLRNVSVSILPTYFSYHEAILIKLDSLM